MASADSTSPRSRSTMRVAVALQLLQLVGEHPQSGREGVGPLRGVLGQRGGGQFTDLLPGRGADLLVAGGVGVPYEDVARLAHGGLGGRQVGGAAAQRAAGLGGGLPGLLQACPGRARAPRAASSSAPVVAQQVAQQGGGLVEAARRVLGGAVGAQQFGVRVAGRRPTPRCAVASSAGGRAQQGLGLLGVGGDQVLGELGVARRRPAGASRSASPRSRPSCSLAVGRPGLQDLDQRLGAGGGGLPGGAVGAVGAFEELGGAGADLVAEPVELGEGGALVALGAGLFGAQVGADADLLVQLGGGAVGLAQGGQGRLRGASASGSGRSSGAPAISARSARRARAVRRASSAARWAAAAVLVGGAGALQAGLGAGLGLGGLVGEFAQP